VAVGVGLWGEGVTVLVIVGVMVGVLVIVGVTDDVLVIVGVTGGELGQAFPPEQSP
jgi:hypothetical protein